MIRDLREHAPNCAAVGSPLYGALLEMVAVGLESDGAWWQFFEPHAADPPRSILPLRFLALFHKLALTGELPALASCYPTCGGGTADPEGAYQAIYNAVLERGEELSKRIPSRVQTNEVGRCRALIPGFREVAAALANPAMPWRLLELGCSAGLNLLWDRFGFELGFPPPHIVERTGCDAAPVPATGENLLPFIWPDQLDRFELLQRALRIAAEQPPAVDEADALDWVASKLANLGHTGVATVLFHSIFWMYLDGAAQARLESIIREAGAHATALCPLAWLRMEPANKSHAEVLLTLWPGDGATRRIAKSGFHGAGVELLGAAS